MIQLRRGQKVLRAIRRFVQTFSHSEYEDIIDQICREVISTGVWSSWKDGQRAPFFPRAGFLRYSLKLVGLIGHKISRRFSLKFLSFHIQGAQSWRLWGGQGLQVHLQHWREALVLGDGLPHQGGGLLVLHGSGQGVHGEVAEVQLRGHHQLQGLPQGGRDNARGPENANPKVCGGGALGFEEVQVKPKAWQAIISPPESQSCLFLRKRMNGLKRMRMRQTYLTMRLIQMKRSKPRPALNQRRTTSHLFTRWFQAEQWKRWEILWICSHLLVGLSSWSKKKNGENASSDDALGTSERKRKLDVKQSYPDLGVQYASEEEIIKNVVLSKRHRSSRQIG